MAKGREYGDQAQVRGITTVLLTFAVLCITEVRRLMDALGTRYRMVAPDYPGFGHTEAPVGFTDSFAHLADVMEGLVQAVGLDHFAMYLFAFGGPVGFRLAARHPEWVDGLIIQNANAYHGGCRSWPAR
jgi:pimeloyl-ACP methyl ester carboxylesterase